MAKRGGKRAGAGRPKGSRNKATIEHKGTLIELCRTFSTEVVGILMRIARKSESDSARVSACLAILDRSYGKPPQAVLRVNRIDVSKLTDEQLQLLERLYRELAGPGIDGDGATPPRGLEGPGAYCSRS